MALAHPAARRTAGYTLTEVMLTVAILGIVASMAPSLLLQMNRFFRQNNARVAIQREAREALDLINRNLRQAQASTVVVDQVAGEFPHSRIVFTRLTPSGSTVSMSFYQQGSSLFMVRGTSAARALSKNLRYLGFSYPRTDDAKLISVSLTTEAGTFQGQTKALQLSVEKVRIMND
ncbi:MAG: hypothetical protein COV48_02950 [Elusimicrobia bacterium CG11_big_fil_rev_8_21_14_0_20_64_6]|nr:MAG: hypothetical protein COV48_02950 [Elusimicrobia bacterium CG11_big_fil_rev_8_21_14_0_20_64_6]